MIKAHLALLGQLVFLLGLNQRDGVVVRGVAKKGHAMLVFVGKLKAHDFRPKLGAALYIANAQDHMTDLLNFYRSFFLRHKELLSLSQGPVVSGAKGRDFLSRKMGQGKVAKCSGELGAKEARIGYQFKR